MFYFSKPSEQTIEKVIEQQSELPLSYREVGETKYFAVPRGFPINHLRRKLGKGETVYRKAVAALYSWQMYALEWTEVYPKNARAAENLTTATLVNHLGFWSLNPCRVVYTLHEETEFFRRDSFAIGTLPAHSEQGEERFTIEHSKQTDVVWYELYAFARAHDPIAKIGFPFVPFFQKRFAADSYKAMICAIEY